MPLQDFHGRWREIETSGDSKFWSSMGVGWLKRFLLMKLKRDFEIEVKNEKEYIYIEKRLKSREEVTLGVQHFRTNLLGRGKAMVNQKNDTLMFSYEILESNNSTFTREIQR